MDAWGTEGVGREKTHVHKGLTEDRPDFESQLRQMLVLQTWASYLVLSASDSLSINWG